MVARRMHRTWESDVGIYVIAEAGINHIGDYDTAIELIWAAKSAGADACKFQTYVTDRICKPSSDQYAELKKCELAYVEFENLKRACERADIDFLSTPDDLMDAAFLCGLGMKYMKIGSANNSNGFVEALGHMNFLNPVPPLIISLGMGASGIYDTEIPIASLMHCVSSYPAPWEDANMARIGGRINGFSDHSKGTMAAVMAVARGVQFIEKHITMDKDQVGPDHHMSCDPEYFKYYVKCIRQAEQMLGDGQRKVMPSEQKTIALLESRK